MLLSVQGGSWKWDLSNRRIEISLFSSTKWPITLQLLVAMQASVREHVSGLVRISFTENKHVLKWWILNKMWVHFSGFSIDGLIFKCILEGQGVVLQLLYGSYLFTHLWNGLKICKKSFSKLKRNCLFQFKEVFMAIVWHLLLVVYQMNSITDNCSVPY